VLKGIPDLLTADVLYLLAAMGHGDELAIVDRNFPATSTAKRLARLDGADACAAARAVLALFPLDTFVEQPLLRMEVVGAAGDIPDVQREFLAEAEKAEERPVSMGSLSRADFYERTRSAFGVISTSEARPYGCFLLVKGVIMG
jgi:L-fucose mutarotase